MESRPLLPARFYQHVFSVLPSPCLIVHADPCFTIVDANDAYLRETVSERDQLVGQPLLDVFPDNPDNLKEKATQSLAESLRWVVRYRRTDAMPLQRYDVPDRASGNGQFLKRFWSPINVPVLDHDGSVAFILHRVENVTDLVSDVLQTTDGSTVHALPHWWIESESELIRGSRRLGNANAELRRVSEEAVELAARLKEESTRKDEFLAMLGHELRNPLAGLASAFQLIQGSDANRSIPVDITALIHRQIATLTRLVDDLLDASRVSRGAIKLAREIVDLRMVVETAAYSVRRDFELKRHTLSINISPDDYSLRGDETRLQQVVANLLSNAVKYTDAGGNIEVRLRTRGPKRNRRAVLTVSDNGRGIPQAFLETIFELFAQVHTTMDRAEGGLGIGLNLARRLVELHGGTLRAQSRGEGKGSEFTVELPLVEAPQRQPEPSTTLACVTATPNVTVLLVEDNEDVRLATAAMLESLGYVVTTARDGPDGLAAIESTKPAVAIVDIGLPGLDGYEVARHARRLLGSSCPFLIALSGYSGAEVAARAKASGFDCSFVKPVNVSLLRSTIESFALG